MSYKIDVLHPFNYENVKLRDSHWKKQFEHAVEYYLNIPNDALLYPFRIKASLDAPGKPLTGWYGSNPSIFGQIIGAFAKMLRITKDIRIKEKVLYLVKEWEKCADKSEEVLTYDTYSFDKMIGGLLDLYEFMGYDRGVDYIKKLTNIAIKKFKRDIKRNGLQDSELVKNGMIEWYTLPENLYRAYELTGENLYKEFAEVWEYDYYWEKLLANDHNIGPRHAYSHVNTLNSAARAYQVKKENKYLQIIKNGYDFITSQHIFATGGYGPAETLFVEKEGYLGDSLKPTWELEDPTYVNFAGMRVTRSDTWGSFEVSCGSWAVFKLTNYLLRFTGEAKYSDWEEKLLYNGVGALIPLGPNGKIMYYASYFVDGAIKTVEDRRLTWKGENFNWQCCTGTFPHDVCEYFNMLYYYDESGIYVNQYLPSTVEWTKDNTKIRIENFSQYPEEDCLKFRIEVEKPVMFSFNFRVPSWVKGNVKIKVNGEDINLELRPNTWGKITREWKNDDIITIYIPFELYFKPVDKKNSDIVALVYGPLVLVTDEMTLLIGDPENPGGWIRPIEGERLSFITDKGHVGGYDFVVRKFVPFYKVGPMEWYFMYNKIIKK